MSATRFVLETVAKILPATAHAPTTNVSISNLEYFNCSSLSQ